MGLHKDTNRGVYKDMMNKDKIMWGTPCRRHGCRADNTCLRFKQKNGLQGACVLCHKNAPLDTDQDIFYAMCLLPNKPKRTPEEKAAGAVAASLRWNAKNKEKVQGYIKKYQQRDDVRERNSKKRRDAYAALSPEEKTAYAQVQYQNRLKREDRVLLRDVLAAMTPEELAQREEHRRVHRNEVARARYALKTEADKAAEKVKRAEYIKTSKERKALIASLEIQDD
jgi:hypothetical protein